MNQELLRHLKEKQQVVESVPSNDIIKGWVQDLIFLLYPEHNRIIYPSTAEIDNRFDLLKEQLLKIFKGTTACDGCDNELKAEQFFENIPELYRVLNTDVDAIFQGDPSAKSRFEVVRAYPRVLCYLLLSRCEFIAEAWDTLTSQDYHRMHSCSNRY